MKKKFIIIGAGLAGSFLAARLLEKGQEVVIFDKEKPNSASRTAAGMFNIITGKHATKTWLAEDLLQSLQLFFASPSFSTLKKHLHFLPIYRPFREIAEYNRWLSAGKEFENYVKFQEKPIFSPQIQNDLGGIWINGCGWMDIPHFIQDLLLLLIQKKGLKYHTQDIHYEQIHLNEKYLNLPDGKLFFDEIIFCQGSEIHLHPLWEIPLTPTKGEAIRISAPELSIPFLLSAKVYIVPHEGGEFTVGATNDWRFSDDLPSLKGKEELLEGLNEVIKTPYQVLNHRAAIRPATHDRRPVLGTHPTIPHLHIFTGFGTKGVLLAPYFSDTLAQYLLKEIPQLPKECEIMRYYRKGKMKI